MLSYKLNWLLGKQAIGQLGIMGDFRKLEIWQRAHKLTLEVYKLSKKLPKEELYGLTSQVTRAAVSVESNIAEGESRYTDPAKIRFFIDARASVSEVIFQLTIVKDVYTNLKKDTLIMIKEYEILAKQINSLISFRRKNPFQPKSLIAQMPNSPN